MPSESKKRSVLLVTHYLDISGSSTFLQTLASFLQKKDFEIFVFGIVVDPIVQERLEEGNIQVISDLKKIKNKKIEFIIGQHNIPVLVARHFFPEQPLLFIVHGILSPTETPPSIDIGISHFIAISEEVKQKIVRSGWAKASNVTIVRNFIDTHRFRIKKPIRKKPKKVLFLSSRYTEDVVEKIKKVCALLKMELVVIGREKKDFLIEKYIQDSDIVISLGRGALESMSCGRPVIVFDYQGGDGMVTEKNYSIFMKKNFSGRTMRKNYSVQELAREFNKYEKSASEKLRAVVLNQFNVEVGGEKVITILKSIKNQKQIPPPLIPYKEIRWLIDRINYFADAAKNLP